MYLLGDLGHRGILRHVLGEPGDGVFDGALGMPFRQGQRANVELAQRQQRELDEGTLETQLADGGRLVKVRFQLAGELHQLPAFLRRDGHGEVTAFAHDELELVGHGAKMEGGDVSAAGPVAGPAVSAAGGKDPKGARLQARVFVVIEDRPATSLDHRVKLPVHPWLRHEGKQAKAPVSLTEVTQHEAILISRYRRMSTSLN